MEDAAPATNGDARWRFHRPDDIFQVRVSLIDVEPPIWRRLVVPQDVNLPRLHDMLQVTMGWTNSHLHQFKVGDIRFAEPESEFDPPPIDYRRITLNQIAPHRGTSCVYEYDFGDSWDHLIEVEDELRANAVTKHVPYCIAGERSCPPEDCGGPSAYSAFLVAFGNPDNQEHEEWRRWAGPDFDPAAFDLELVNRKLARLAGRSPRQSGASRGKH